MAGAQSRRLTIFAHANTGEDLADHTQHVIWFGQSEAARPVDLQLIARRGSMRVPAAHKRGAERDQGRQRKQKAR